MTDSFNITYWLTFASFNGSRAESVIALAEFGGTSPEVVAAMCVCSETMYTSNDYQAAVDLQATFQTLGVATDLWSDEEALRAARVSTHVVPPVNGQRRRYKEVACDHCGLIVPKNELVAFAYEEQTGRQGSSTRYSSGASSRSSSSFSSNGSSRQGYSSGSSARSSVSSGRKYYRTVKVQLCQECFGPFQAEQARIARTASLSNAAVKTVQFFLQFLTKHWTLRYAS